MDGMKPDDFDHPADYRQWLRHKHVQAAVEQVYAHCFADDLTDAESKLAWVEVIAKLVEIEIIDRSTVVVTESLGLARHEAEEKAHD